MSVKHRFSTPIKVFVFNSLNWDTECLFCDGPPKFIQFLGTAAFCRYLGIFDVTLESIDE